MASEQAAEKRKAPRAPRQPKLLVQRRNGQVILVAKNGVTAGRLASVAGLGAGLEIPSLAVPRDKALEMIDAVLGA